MSPAAIIALLRDAAILGALIFVVIWIRTDGANSVKVSDLKALQDQIADTARKQQQYAQEVSNAQTQHSHDVETISAAIASHSVEPVRVCVSASSSTLHGVSAATPAQPTGGGSSDSGSRGAVPPVDIRPGIVAFEQQYENALADCRQALNSWPR